MAAIFNFSSSLHASAAPATVAALLPPRFPRTTPGLSLYSRFCSSSSFPSISARHLASLRPRSLVISSSAFKTLAETEPLAVAESEQLPPASGVYAVYDKEDELQFVGITRNIAASVSAHFKSLPDLCGSVKVGVVEDPDKAALKQAWKSWVEEHIKLTGKVPPGNKSGNDTWVKQTPTKKNKSDIRLTPGRHVQLTVPLQDLIDRLVKENNIVAFIKGSRNAPLCGFSQRVVGILESQSVDYETVDVLDEEYNHGLRETLKAYSNWPTFPQVYVKGEFLGGCDILSSMHETGELAQLFNK